MAVRKATTHKTKTTSPDDVVSEKSMATSPEMSQYGSSPAPYSITGGLLFISNHFALFFLLGIFFIFGFFCGSLWTENQLLKAGKGAVAANPSATTQPADQGAPAGPTAEQLKSIPAISDEDYVRGPANAKITLVEYSDFECPFCARFHPTMLQVMKDYGDSVRWVYRHYPLPFHPNAQKAAEAAECVVKQKGKDGFWQYADAMFEENNKLGGRLSPEAIEGVVKKLGVDMTTYKRCLDSGETAAKIKQQTTDGAAGGISGTPGTIVLSGDSAELIPGALPYEQVKAILDKYL